MPEWTVEVVAQMHKFGITGNELSEACGYSRSYISLVLNGKKKSGPARIRISNALIKLAAQKQAGCDAR